MLVAALIDLGADPKKIQRVAELAKKHCKGCKKFSIKTESNSDSNSKRLSIEIEDVEERRGLDVRAAIERCCEELDLSDYASLAALEAIEKLISAEVSFHGEHRSQIHFHEMGSADTVFDIVATMAALDDLRLFDSEIKSTPLAVGKGKISFSHGTFDIPAPASQALLEAEGYPLSGKDQEGEMATPTGIALLTTLSDQIVKGYDGSKAKRIGRGSGWHRFKKPVALRLVLI
jgi:uncharacterized protein (DUF111 family)